MHISRRVVAGLGAITLLAAGCGSSGSSSSSSGKGSSSSAVAKSITVWAGSGPFWAYEGAHLAPFEKETGIKVDYEQLPQSGILAKELIAQRAHSSAYAMYQGPTSLIAQNVDVGGGVPLKPLIDNTALTPKSFDLSDFGAGGISDCTYKGNLYCLPMFDDGPALAYNTALFAKAGIKTAPTSWQQVLTDAEAITKTGTPGFCTRGSEAGAAIATANYILPSYIPWSAKNNGFVVSPSWKSLLDSPGALQFAKLYSALMTKNTPSGVGAFTYQNCLTAFDQGKVGMDLDALATFGTAEFSPPASSPIHGKVSFATIACPTSNPCEVTGPWGMWLNPHASTTQLNAAWKLEQYLDSKSFLTGEINATHVPALAVRTSVADEAIPGVPTSYLADLKYIAAHSEPNPFPLTAVFDQSQNDYQTALSAIVGGSNPTTEMKFAANGMNQVFQQAGLK